jgi:hypothetical protein
MPIPNFYAQPYVQNREIAYFPHQTRLIVDITPYHQSVSKLKPTSPYYLPYLDTFFSVIVPPIDPARRVDIVCLLKLGWQPDTVIKQLHISQTTVYNTEHNLM